jgi:hypothetical protein
MGIELHRIDVIEETNENDDAVSNASSSSVLAASPMYFVLQKLLVSTHTGRNVADELASMNVNLSSIATSLEIISRKKNKSRKKSV